MCDCDAAKKPALVFCLEQCFSSRGLYDRKQTLAAYRVGNFKVPAVIGWFINYDNSNNPECLRALPNKCKSPLKKLKSKG
jgi:hypothetical protein